MAKTSRTSKQSPVFVWRTIEPTTSTRPIGPRCHYCLRELITSQEITEATATLITDWTEEFAQWQEGKRLQIEQGFSNDREGLGWDPYDYYWPVRASCKRCGWWVEGIKEGNGAYAATLTQAAALRQFDINDPMLAVKELLSHLAKQFSDVYNLSARRFEEVAADVFSHLGYAVRLTQQTRDGGTDLICVDRSGELHIVECKRYATEHRIGIGIVDRLLGVQFRIGADSATIVTTSSFSKPATAATKEANKKGANLSLVGAHELLQLFQTYSDPSLTASDLRGIFGSSEKDSEFNN